MRAARHTLFLALLAVGCDGPVLRVPRGELSGDPASEPVRDWSFVSSTFLELETRRSDPYSVQLNYVVRDGALYIDPAEGRRWLDDPRVRVPVRFGDEAYPLRAVLGGEPGELDGFGADRFVYRLDPRPEAATGP